MRAVLKDAGVHNYSISLHPKTLQLFAFVEVWLEGPESILATLHILHLLTEALLNPHSSPCYHLYRSRMRSDGMQLQTLKYARDGGKVRLSHAVIRRYYSGRSDTVKIQLKFSALLAAAPASPSLCSPSQPWLR